MLITFLSLSFFNSLEIPISDCFSVFQHLVFLIKSLHDLQLIPHQLVLQTVVKTS